MARAVLIQARRDALCLGSELPALTQALGTDAFDLDDPIEVAFRDAESPVDGGKTPVPRQTKRSSSAFQHMGLKLSTTYLTATFGGAPAFYSLWLSEKCTSTVVVHLQFTTDSLTGKATVIKLSCDRVVFTPENALEPQIVRVEMVEQCTGTNIIVHRVFSLDMNFDRIQTQDVVVKTEKSSAGSLLLLGGALVHKRKNAKGEIMEPRHSANRTIDLAKALAVPAAAAAAAAAAEDSDGSFFLTSCSIPSASTSPDMSSSIFVSHMAAGCSFSAVLVKNQSGVESLLTWGMNSSGELGIGSTTPMVDPALVPIPRHLHGESLSIVNVACGKHHAAIATSQGRLFTWGNNKHGQLGLGDFTPYIDSPQEVVFASALVRVSHQRALRIKHMILEHGATNVTQVACGAYHTLFVTHQQHILSMGYNQAGQLGIGHRLQHHKGWRSCTPIVIDTLRDLCILDLAAGQNHSACVVSNGDVYVWGCGGDGRLGVPLANRADSDCQLTPVPVLALKDLGVRARTVRCGSRHTAVISDRDLLYVWGANEFGQLGLGDKRNRPRPCLVQFSPFLLDGVVDVALGEFHSACLTWSGEAFVWGLDLSVEQSTRLDQRWSPERIVLPPNEVAVKISCGWAHTTLLSHRVNDSGLGDDNETETNPDSKAKRSGHAYRRREKSQQATARKLEAAKWRRISSALAVMTKLQSRMSLWRKIKAKKQAAKAQQPAATEDKSRFRLADVVAMSFRNAKRKQQQQEEDSKRRLTEVAAAVAKTFVESAIEEGRKRAVAKKIDRKQRKKRRAARLTRQPRRQPSPPRGVFYHSVLESLAPPTLPPACLSTTATAVVSPRQVIASLSSPTCLSPVPTPPPSRPRSRPATAASPSSRSLRPTTNTASYASLLSALQDEDAEEQRRSSPSPRTSTPRAKQSHRAVESLLHQPSFSLAGQLARQPLRRRKPA